MVNNMKKQYIRMFISYKKMIPVQTIRGRYVDVVNSEIYSASIDFDTHIRSIRRLPETQAPDVYILPGLVDAHVHIESSMLPPSEFARMALSHGTLAAVADPHEIANVAGIAGIDYMLEDATRVPFCFVFGAPSCVPATPFDATGIALTAADIEMLFQTRKLSFLSEMMNFPGVINRDPDVMAKIAVAKKYGKPIDGHAPGLTGEKLRLYAEAGISTDHECITLEEAEEKIRSGMKILIREGSAAKNFDTLCPLIEKHPEKIMLCTDDFHPDDLLRGHINLLIAKGFARGFDLFSLLRAATLNPIEHYRIDLGLLQTGDSADFIVVNNLNDFTVRQSFFHGLCVFDRAGESFDIFTDMSSISTNINRFDASTIGIPDIQIFAASDKMKIIQTLDGELYTKKFVVDVRKDALVETDTDADILKLVVLNRYRPAKPAVAFIRGFGLKQGALVSTVAHDSHHIVAVGCDDHSLVETINHIISVKGGLASYYNQQLICMKLDIAGLMSSDSAEDIAHAYEQLNKTVCQMGSTLIAPFMTLSFMALLVIPELKLGDRGLFDVQRFEWTDTFEKSIS